MWYKVCTIVKTCTKMSLTSNILLTGGTHNRILCAHADVCHHCGYIGGGRATNVCATCGKRTHNECVPAFKAGICDECHHPGEMCAICGIDHDDRDVSVDAMDRLVMVTAFHGRCWSSSSFEEPGCIRIPSDSEVAQRLSQDKTSTFKPSQLPEGMGGEPMSVVVDGVLYVSRPMMVHSWCAQNVFQMNPAPTGSTAWNAIVDSIDAPPCKEFAESSVQHKLGGINPVSGCSFCGSLEGFQVFCYGHMNSCRGCSNCNWSIRPHLSYTSFHPSCAVRAGMYRIIDATDGGSGLMCHKSMAKFLPKVHKMKRNRCSSARVQRVERWLEQSGGFHIDVASRIDPVSLIMTISQTLPVMGSRYETFPLAGARRVVHKRKRSQHVGNCLPSEVFQKVVEPPIQDRDDPHASPRSEDEDPSNNGDNNDEAECEDDAQVHQFADRSMTHSSHSQMTFDESSELIQKITSPQLLEAIDVRIAWQVEKALKSILPMNIC